MEAEILSKKQNHNKKKLRWLLILAMFLCILGFICLYNFYDCFTIHQITGRWDCLGKPVESFDSPERSFHGDDCIVKIYKIPKPLEDYFVNHHPKLSDYPKPTSDKKLWERVYIKKWTRGIPAKADLVLKTLNNWDVPTKIVNMVETSLTLETSYFSYIAPSSSFGPNFDFYILDPLNDWLIIIFHAM